MTEGMDAAPAGDGNGNDACSPREDGPHDPLDRHSDGNSVGSMSRGEPADPAEQLGPAGARDWHDEHTTAPQFHTEFEDDARESASTGRGSEWERESTEAQTGEHLPGTPHDPREGVGEDTDEQVSEATDRLMTALEAEAELEAQIDRETEAQILLLADRDAAAPDDAASRLSSAGRSTAVLEVAGAWLPAEDGSPGRAPSAEGADDDSLLIEQALMQSALRWLFFNPRLVPPLPHQQPPQLGAASAPPPFGAPGTAMDAGRAGELQHTAPKFFDESSAALVLQSAFRCHRSRRMHATHAARRAGNVHIDFERMASRLIQDLTSEDVQSPDDVLELILHGIDALVLRSQCSSVGVHRGRETVFARSFGFRRVLCSPRDARLY